MPILQRMSGKENEMQDLVVSTMAAQYLLALDETLFWFARRKRLFPSTICLKYMTFTRCRSYLDLARETPLTTPSTRAPPHEETIAWFISPLLADRQKRNSSLPQYLEEEAERTTTLLSHSLTQDNIRFLPTLKRSLSKRHPRCILRLRLF